MQIGKSITLILGGARSGKSAYAERLGDLAEGEMIYLATARVGDEEMAERISLHRERRGAAWTTLEEPLALAEAIATQSGPGTFILVDCLTLWLTNLLLAERDIESETLNLLDTLEQIQGSVVFVSNEVGQGIVPDNALARVFRDEAGRLNQRIAQAADCVVLMTAGLPLALKGELITS